MTSPPPILSLSELTVAYPGFTLHPTTISFVDGERVAILGHNGSGKTTLLHAIAGRTRESRGEVRWSFPDSSPPRPGQTTGLLPDRLMGFGWMTVSEHLKFLSAFHPEWDDAYATDLQHALRVPRDRKLANLSRGMSVKVGLISTVASHPPILLLDEPTSGIDPGARAEILRALHHHCRHSVGQVLLFSTHLLEDVETIATRVLLLHGGQIVVDQPICDIRRSSSQPVHVTLRALLDAQNHSL